MNLDFAHSLSSVRVLGHEGCVNEAVASIPSHRLPASSVAGNHTEVWRSRLLMSLLSHYGHRCRCRCVSKIRKMQLSLVIEVCRARWSKRCSNHVDMRRNRGIAWIDMCMVSVRRWIPRSFVRYFSMNNASDTQPCSRENLYASMPMTTA